MSRGEKKIRWGPHTYIHRAAGLVFLGEVVGVRGWVGGVGGTAMRYPHGDGVQRCERSERCEEAEGRVAIAALCV